MKKNIFSVKQLVCMLVMITILGMGISVPMSQLPLNAEALNPAIFVEKKVWDGSSYVESVEVNEGEIVEFSVVIYNPYDYYEIHWSGIIYDQLPCNLRYINWSTVGLPLEWDHPELDPEYYDIETNMVTWQIDRESPILPHQYLNFTYQTIAVCCGDEYLENVLTVSPSELIHVCDPTDIIENNGSLDVSDSASVKVICEEPDIQITKQVNNGEGWMDTATIYEDDDVEFRLLIENTGLVNLTAVQVTDTLPLFLSYNYDATIPPISATDHQINWEIASLLVNETVEIIFSAHADAVGEGDNHCIVHTCQGPSDEDTAHVMVSGMIVEKKVWSQQHMAWMDEIDASVDDLIRFRITVYYIGNGSFTLYNIKIRDELPECLEYRDNADPAETGISGDMKTIWWNLSSSVSAGDHISVEFDALITSSGCGPCENLANVSANECSGHYFMKEDTATVNAECPLISDAGGPYCGDINEQIFIQGDATGGSPPYTYRWDLDDDGYFDDFNGQSLYYSWDDADTYTISVKVTDSDLREDTESTTVTIYPPDNSEPDTPERPSGEDEGMVDEEYVYETSSSDSDDDLIRYGWDWNGDGSVDEWTGYYESDLSVSMSYQWNSPGTYQVKVKAEDEHGEQSDFSLSLQVTITDDSAPMKPSISGPTSGKTGISYSYSASATDPDGDILYYWFDWGDGKNSGWKGPYASGQTVIESHTWEVQGSYSVKVKVKDNAGLESVWSDPLPITMPKTAHPLHILMAEIYAWMMEVFSHLPFFLTIF